MLDNIKLLDWHYCFPFVL